jgi:hypothetical protein
MASPLKSLSDDELVERVPVDAPGDRIWQQAPYVLEMERRLLVAISAFKAEARRQANIVIALTAVLAVLTVVIAVLTAVLVWKG